MLAFIIMAVFIAVITLLVLLVGLGLGWLLHTLLPAIDPGSAVLTALISLALGIWVYTRITGTLFQIASEQAEDEPEEVVIPDGYRVTLVPPKRSRRRRS